MSFTDEMIAGAARKLASKLRETDLVDAEVVGRTSRRASSSKIAHRTPVSVAEKDDVALSKSCLSSLDSGAAQQPAAKRFRKSEEAAAKETAGSKWFDLPAPQITPELKRDLVLLRNRAALDPKRHYKKENNRKLPKYFQIGEIIEGPTEFYSARLTRKERKKSLAEELLADSAVLYNTKRSFQKIVAEKDSRRPSRRPAPKSQKRQWKKRRG